MELRRLRYFLRVAADGSVTRASAVLRVAQPAPSRQMKLLEAELGASLFTRTSHGMRLSPAGERLRDVVAGPLRDLELALQSFRPDSGKETGTFTVGLPSNLSDLLAAPLISRTKVSLPDTKLRVIHGPTGSLIEWLARGIVDLAVLEGPSADQRLRDRTLVELPLFVVGSKAEAWPLDQAVSLEQFLLRPLVLPVHHLGIRSIIDTAAADFDVTMNVGAEADPVSAIRKLAAQDIGYALLPACYLGDACDLEDLNVWKLKETAPRLPIVLSNRKKSQGARGTAQVIDTAITELAEAFLV